MPIQCLLPQTGFDLLIAQRFQAVAVERSLSADPWRVLEAEAAVAAAVKASSTSSGTDDIARASAAATASSDAKDGKRPGLVDASGSSKVRKGGVRRTNSPAVRVCCGVNSG